MANESDHPVTCPACYGWGVLWADDRDTAAITAAVVEARTRVDLAEVGQRHRDDPDGGGDG